MFLFYDLHIVNEDDLNFFSLHQDNMTDFILAVEDPFDWHAKNLELNPDDYSSEKKYWLYY